MNGPFTWGAMGQKAPPQQGQQRIAQLLANVQPIEDPMQGVAQMAQSAVSAYNADRQGKFPEAPGGGSPFTSLFGLGNLFGGSGGLY